MAFAKTVEEMTHGLTPVLTKLPINEAINEGSRGGITLISQVSVSRVVLEMIHLAKDGHINISTAGKQIYGRWLIKFPPLSIHKGINGPPHSPHFRVKRSVSAGYQGSGSKVS